MLSSPQGRIWPLYPFPGVVLVHTAIIPIWMIGVASDLAPYVHLSSMQLGSCSDLSSVMSVLCSEPSSGCSAESLVGLGSPLEWMLLRPQQACFRLSDWQGLDKVKSTC